MVASSQAAFFLGTFFPTTFLFGSATMTLLATPHSHWAPRAGDYIATTNALNVTTQSTVRVGIDVDCKADELLTTCPLAVYWELSVANYSARLWRVSSDGTTVTLLKDEPPLPKTPPPWTLRLVRRGAFYVLRLNGLSVAWVKSPRVDLDCSSFSSPDRLEPFQSGGKVEIFPQSVSAVSVEVHEIEWARSPFPSAPIIEHSSEHGSWFEGQAFPGAVHVDDDGSVWIFTNGASLNDPSQEAGGQVMIGLAKHKPGGNLTAADEWVLAERPVILPAKRGWDNVSVFANAVVKAPDGRLAVTYMGFGRDSAHPNGWWGGIGIAYGETVAGPFNKNVEPMIPINAFPPWAQGAVHEHDIQRLENGTYVLLFTGYDGTGDQGGLATSEDLATWSFYPEPVLRHRALSGATWDGVHLRPRGLNRLGDYWYLFYEGANTEPTGSNHRKRCWGDSIGLARSHDLIEWEMDWSLELAVAQQPGDRFDSVWTGWPRSIQVGEDMFVFYAAGGYGFDSVNHFASTAVRVVPVSAFKEGWKEPQRGNFD